MTVYLVTGKLGSGKSLVAVGRAVDYASQGRKIVANFAIDLSQFPHRRGSKIADVACGVIPSRPTASDLLALGVGGETEETAGLLILDEAATFLNSRDWNSADRKGVIDWFLHSRKLKWDVILICQHQSLLDKQVRESVCEMLVTCNRLDRLSVPVISWFTSIKLPRIHVAKVRYGLGVNDLKAETWTYRGNHLFAVYQTQEIFDGVESGPYTMLPPRLSKWRYIKPRKTITEWLLEEWDKPAVNPLPRPPLKPKTRLVELLASLPADQREKHWTRLSALGAI